MKATLVITGLDDLRTALRALPMELNAEAADIVLRRANDAANQIRDAYPIGPGRKGKAGGTLKAKVRVDQLESTRFGVRVRVVSAAPHAHLYEFGTELRVTSTGASRGRMPEPTHPTFVPITQRARKLVTQDQIAMFRRHGFEVTGGFA